MQLQGHRLVQRIKNLLGLVILLLGAERKRRSETTEARKLAERSEEDLGLWKDFFRRASRIAGKEHTFDHFRNLYSDSLASNL